MPLKTGLEASSMKNPLGFRIDSSIGRRNDDSNDFLPRKPCKCDIFEAVRKEFVTSRDLSHEKDAHVAGTRRAGDSSSTMNI